MNGRDGHDDDTREQRHVAHATTSRGRLRIGIAIAVAAAVLLAGGVAYLGLRDDPQPDPEIATQARQAPASTVPPTAPPTSAPAPTTVPTTIPATTPTTTPQTLRLNATGLGPLRFGATLSEARAAFGEVVTDITRCGRVPRFPTTDLGFWEDRFLFVVTTSPSIETEGGFRVGSSMRDIEARYPNATREFDYKGGLALVVREGGAKYYYYDGATRGDEQPRPTVVAIRLLSAEADRIYFDGCV